MSVLLFVMEAAARRVLDLIAVERLDAHARGGVPEGFHRRQIFRGRGFSEAWTHVSAAGNPAKMRLHRLFMAVTPFSQRIQRGSQIGVGNGSIEESIDQSILPDNHHPVR